MKYRLRLYDHKGDLITHLIYENENIKYLQIFLGNFPLAMLKGDSLKLEVFDDDN